MKRTAGWVVAAAVCVMAVLLPPSGTNAAPAMDGICPSLGCVGGETKCADGEFTTEDGIHVEYTCYTVEPQ